MEAQLDADVNSVSTIFKRESRTAALGRAARLTDGSKSTPTGQGVTEAKLSYEFGDFSRGVLAKGRILRGGRAEDVDSYQFGDFSRGLLRTMSGLTGTNDNDAVQEAQEMTMLSNQSARMGLAMVAEHLNDFLVDNPESTYEQWIAVLHPENAKHLNTTGLDSRFYLKDSDHLVLWNRQCKEGRNVIPRVPQKTQAGRRTTL